MSTRVVLTKALKKGIKTVVGTILQETFDKLTVAVIDSKGSTGIKTFKKADYNIRKEEI